MGRSEVGAEAASDLGRRVTEALHRTILAEEPDKLAVTIPPSERSGEPISERLSIAVLPFKNMSGDPEQQYFSDGFTEDIITKLSRFRSFSVMARNSSFVYRGDSVDVGKVGREARGDRGDNHLDQFVLHREQIADRPVIPVRPDVIAAASLQELSRNTDQVAGAPHTAFDDEALKAVRARSLIESRAWS